MPCTRPSHAATLCPCKKTRSRWPFAQGHGHRQDDKLGQAQVRCRIAPTSLIPQMLFAAQPVVCVEGPDCSGEAPGRCRCTMPCRGFIGPAVKRQPSASVLHSHSLHTYRTFHWGLTSLSKLLAAATMLGQYRSLCHCLLKLRSNRAQGG